MKFLVVTPLSIYHEHRAVLESFDLSNVWVPCITASSLCSMDQDGPQLNGQPLVADDRIRGLT